MLTRVNATGFVAAACALVVVALPAAAYAQSTRDRVASTRHALDEAAAHWFAAQNKLATVDALIERHVRDIKHAETRVATLRQAALSRARLMYEGASVDYLSIIGDSAMDSARRAQLIENANARDNATIDDLTASLEDLHTQQTQLAKEREREKHALDSLAEQRRTLDARLTTLRAEVARDDARRAAAARRLAAEASDTASTGSTAAPTAPPSVSGGSAPAPPPSGGRVSPHHNDPFLVCTRARESGGNYGVVSADGLYYGAYQFLRSTWDLTASHVGRMDLVGVLPNRASEYDQDEMAWALYQWQGKAPWGGRC